MIAYGSFSMPEIGCIVKRDGSVVPFDARKIETAVYKAFASLGVHDRPLAAGISDKVVEVLERAYSTESPPTVEDIQDVVENALIAGGHAAAAKKYIIYRFKRSQARQSRDDCRRNRQDNIPYRILWRDFIWNADHGVDTAEKFNMLLRSGGFPGLVSDSEKRYEDQIDRIGEDLASARGRVKVIIIAGPSSSGKTTTTIKLGERLSAAGISLRALNVDNYFYDIHLHPRDALGDYDYETPEALDLNLLNSHLADLVDGKAVQVPTYDFKTGTRTGRTTEMRLGGDEVLLLDCLHGLYDHLTESVPAEKKSRIYVETLEQIRTADREFVRWTDIRLLRRMVRDTLHRSYDSRKTLMHWHYVRRAEMKHIIPFIGDVDFIVNSALPYEIPVLKHLLFDKFPGFIGEFEGREEYADAFIRASRVRRMLAEFDSIPDHGRIPADSLLREFIGGSAYKY